MGQGPEVVRQAADHVTAPVDQDGAALELRRWFPADRLETA
jgi:hydroxymethylpyrimidine pyrophosphatase-like HAD family hydrolase